MNDIASKVMQEIKNRHISMRPRFFFVVASFLLVGGLSFTFILTIFLVHLILFRLRVDAPFEFLRFGPAGIPPFFIMFPWRFLLIAAFAIIFGIYLLKKCEFSYKHNFATLVAIVVIAVLLSGLLIDRTGVNRRLEKLRPTKGFYQHRLPGENWVAGEILEISGDSVWVKSLDGRQIVVILDETTMLPMGRDFKVGESIRAFGEWQDTVLQAKGIMPGTITPSFPFPLGPPFQPRPFFQ